MDEQQVRHVRTEATTVAPRDLKRLCIDAHDGGIEIRQPQPIELEQALVDQGPIIGRGLEQSPVAPLSSVGGRHAYGESFDDQIGTRLLPRRRDLVAGDGAVPQGSPARAHVPIVVY